MKTKQTILLAIVLALTTIPLATAIAVYPPVSSSMVLYYHFNNDTNYSENDTFVHDYSLAGNNGNVTLGYYNGTDGVLSDGAFYFNTTGFINVTNSQTINLSGNYTLSIWFRNVRASSRFFSKRDATGLNYLLGIDGTGKITFQNSGLNTTTVTTTGTYSNLAGWNQAVVTYNGSNISIYVNGVLVTSALATGTTATSTGPLYLGRDYNGGNTINGSIDEATIYNQSLSPAAILLIYQHYQNICGTQPIDGCVINQGITTLETATYQLNDSLLSGAIRLNSSNAVLDCNGATLIGNWTGSTVYQSKAIRTLSFSNITIKNCFITNYHQNILLGSTTAGNLTVTNVTLNNTYYSIYIGQSLGDIIINNSTFINATFAGVYSPAPTSTATQGVDNLQIVNNNFSQELLRPINIKGRNDTLQNNKLLLTANIFGIANALENNDTNNDSDKDGTITIHYFNNVTIANMSVKGNRTIFSTPLILLDVNNLTIDNYTANNYQYGIYMIRSGKTQVGDDWVCSDVGKGVTIKNSNLINNDVGLWIDAANNINISNNNLINNTNNVDSYNLGLFLGVCTNNTLFSNNVISEIGSKGVYGVSTNNITITNNIFSIIPSINGSQYRFNNLQEFPVAISFEELYEGFPQTNYSTNINNANNTFLTSLKSRYINISNNTFYNTNTYLRGDGMQNLTHDITPINYISYLISNFTDRTEIFNSINSTGLISYSGGNINNIGVIQYRFKSYKTNYTIFNQSYSFTNINNTETFTITIYNSTQGIIYYNNLTSQCNNIPNCNNEINTSIAPLQIVYIINRYTINQSLNLVYNPVTISGTNTIYLTNTMLDTIGNVSITVLSLNTPVQPVLQHNNYSENITGTYYPGSGLFVFTADLTAGTNILYLNGETIDGVYTTACDASGEYSDAVSGAAGFLIILFIIGIAAIAYKMYSGDFTGIDLQTLAIGTTVIVVVGLLWLVIGGGIIAGIAGTC